MALPTVGVLQLAGVATKCCRVRKVHRDYVFEIRILLVDDGFIRSPAQACLSMLQARDFYLWVRNGNEANGWDLYPFRLAMP
jgi:hypothetical protein